MIYIYICDCMLYGCYMFLKLFEPVREKTSNLGFRPGQTQTALYSHGFRKKRDCTIRVAKTKAMISFAVTAKLICAFVFAYADCWFSYPAAHFLYTGTIKCTEDTYTFLIL